MVRIRAHIFTHGIGKMPIHPTASRKHKIGRHNRRIQGATIRMHREMGMPTTPIKIQHISTGISRNTPQAIIVNIIFYTIV
jgi:hypothetical protein